MAGKPPWTFEEDELLRSMFFKRLKTSEIAEKIGRSEKAIYKRYSFLGLSVRAREKSPTLKNDVVVVVDVDVRPIKTMRPCLTCTDPFLSEGLHNRICCECRKHQGGYVGVVYG